MPAGLLGVKELRDFFRKPGQRRLLGRSMFLGTPRAAAKPRSTGCSSRRKRTTPSGCTITGSTKTCSSRRGELRRAEDQAGGQPPRASTSTSKPPLVARVVTPSGSARRSSGRRSWRSQLQDFEDKLRLGSEPAPRTGPQRWRRPEHRPVGTRPVEGGQDANGRKLLDGKYEWSSIGKQLREKVSSGVL